MRVLLLFLAALLPAALCGAGDSLHHVQIEVVSDLPKGNVPLDPRLNLGEVIRQDGGAGVLDPNSIEVVDLQTGRVVASHVTDDFAYADVGRVEWVIADPQSRKYEVRFRSVTSRPPLHSRPFVPRIGTGDLLRYNAGQPRQLELPCPARLVDLTGDGKPDLVGAWNYAYRPGDPWNGVFCFPRSGDPDELQFADPVRVRHLEANDSHDYRHFDQTYMEVDFADFNSDGLTDLCYCPSSSDQLFFYANTGQRDTGGMPIFIAAGKAPRQTSQWEHFRVTDLDGDRIADIIIGNLWLQGTGSGDGVPTFAPIVTLNVEDARCFFDVDADGRLDAISMQKTSGAGLSNFAVAWCRNEGASPPRFAPPQPLEAINSRSDRPMDVTSFRDGDRQGLLVTQQHWETMQFFEHGGRADTFKPLGLARSLSAVLGLGDQAWPHGCDWDHDGDLDLLVGGGYGWPRIVINDGTNARPAYREPQPILADGAPIRITRNQVLGTQNWHDMGYPYPAFVDWDGDALPDLMLANETNRIFWHQNLGTREQPRFGPQRQLLCDGFTDSPELRTQSARLADDPQTPRAPYPSEKDQAFHWRTGPAFADFNADGRMDFVTADGQTRQATLFVQQTDEHGHLKLKQAGPLQLTDGRPIESSVIDGSRGWTESYRAADWDRDGRLDLIYTQAGQPSGGSMQLLRNVGTPQAPVFDQPRPLRAFGKLLNITAHGPHPWVGDLDGDSLPDVLACVEWSVYPFFAHNVLELVDRPTVKVTPPVALELRPAD